MRKFYRNRVTVEVLTEYDPVPADLDLAAIAQECITGDWSMGDLAIESVELSPKEAAEALIAQGSDPEFFSLTEEGEDLLASDEE